MALTKFLGSCDYSLKDPTRLHLQVSVNDPKGASYKMSYGWSKQDHKTGLNTYVCKIKYELNPLYMYGEVYRWENMVSTVWKGQIPGILIISCHSSFPIVHNKIKL